VSAVLLPVIGDGKGSSILVSSPQDSLRLVELITKKPTASLVEIDSTAISTISETANIIGGSFLTTLSNATGISFVQSVPKHVTNTMKEVVIMAISAFSHENKEPAVAFEIDFSLSTTTTTTTTVPSRGLFTHYIFMLEVEVAEKLLMALDKQLD